MLAGGMVRVNGEVETRRGRQLERGDVVSVGRQVRPRGRRARRRELSSLAQRLDGSADAEQVDHEDQRLAGLDDAAGAAVAVPEVRRDDELAAAADLHALHALVPALR